MSQQGTIRLPASHFVPVAAVSQRLTAEAAPLTEDEKLALRLRIGSLVDEYDPARPNVYDEIVRNTRKQQTSAAPADRDPLDQNAGLSATETPLNAASPSPFAVNMLRRMGWQDGSGLGREHKGIPTPLVAEAFSGQGVIIPARPVNLAPVAKERKPNAVPSRTVCLLNLIAASDIDENLEDEISDEAEKFGNLVAVKVEVTDGTVRVLCEYETVDDAKKAFTHFDGRFFGGNIISAEFV
eukprot:Gregarina_sp_Pseudo_9__2629@NODE_2889_length_835_cov_6_234925_g2642_i0_p2_GENE_NODE_2889_length_835_cov_6_234925_g2642_i0NODE_2889_length_835_cov_6_234925_g2642_i0_p2_ORF_typecomplete_len240_score64_45Gpatch/PF01585_23/1_6e08Gpatch_2/PF12656_7/5_1e03Gpatch_2/PF12656_7/0_00073RRM_1/PF00076_22/0_0005GPP34/PF05719_11/0_16RRM_8/PF11835_8/0_32_NODE_2889_length_835_cov_6_234925_g2642_i072791